MITNTGGDNQKDVALVLSSGGARGLVHIGVIEELEEQGYHISSIAGASMGALIGGVYAAGKLTEFREWMKGIDKRKMVELTDFSLSINHLVKGNRIIDAIKEIVPDTPIENLPIPYCAVATDWETGREVTFRKGSLFGAIRASISLPAYYEPVRINGMVLIDGGIVNPLPLNRVARKKGDLLVGVDVSELHRAAAQERQVTKPTDSEQTVAGQPGLQLLYPTLAHQQHHDQTELQTHGTTHPSRHAHRHSAEQIWRF